ncbi:MAG: hypothetical protein CMN76_21350 [Spirochaetaceae bacterium]|nr:hypothetical protein [Spirochaetaceae bacterium]
MSARILTAITMILFSGSLIAAEGERPCDSGLSSSIASEQINGARCAAEKGANDYSAELLNLVSSENPDDVKLEAAYALATIDDSDKKEAVISALVEVAGSSSESPVIRYASALTLHALVEKGDDRGQEVTDLLTELSEERDDLLQDLSAKLAEARSK